MNELFDYGGRRPFCSRLWIDRGGRELPIAAQFVGATLDIPANQVLVLERDPDDVLRFNHAGEGSGE
jgi:pyrimidine operon attenuation protein/uracil phosphoribosyltransferase